jgi:hypothetical protein
MTNCILTDFRDLFNTQNFVLFRAAIIGLTANSGRGTVTSIYQASPLSIHIVAVYIHALVSIKDGLEFL